MVGPSCLAGTAGPWAQGAYSVGCSRTRRASRRPVGPADADACHAARLGRLASGHAEARRPSGSGSMRARAAGTRLVQDKVTRHAARHAEGARHGCRTGLPAWNATRSAINSARANGPGRTHGRDHGRAAGARPVHARGRRAAWPWRRGPVHAHARGSSCPTQHLSEQSAGTARAHGSNRYAQRP